MMAVEAAVITPPRPKPTSARADQLRRHAALVPHGKTGDAEGSQDKAAEDDAAFAVARQQQAGYGPRQRRGQRDRQNKQRRLQRAEAEHQL